MIYLTFMILKILIEGKEDESNEENNITTNEKNCYFKKNEKQ